MTTAPIPDPAPSAPPRLSVVPGSGVVDPATLAAMEDQITTLAGHLAAGMASFLKLLRAFDAAGGWQAHGLRSCAQWLSWKCGMSAGTAREHVRVATAMAVLPKLEEAFSAGRLSFSKARAISRVATPETEAELVETAQTCTASQLDRLCSGIKRVRRNEEVLTHRAQARFTATWREDGMLAFSGRLSPEDGASLLAAIVAMKADPVRRQPDAPDGLPEDEYRDAGMLAARADAEALVMMARHALDSPPEAVVADPVRLIVHVGLSDGRSPEGAARENVPAGTFSADVGDTGAAVAGVLDAGPAIPLLPLSPATLERLACGAVIEPAADPDTPEPDRVDSRFANRRQRRALLRRDGGCVFAGCPRKRGLHAHHVVHYSRGGQTTMANLVLLCEHHHLLVHEGGWKLERVGAGWAAVDREGRRHLPAPPTAGDTGGLLGAHRAHVGAETVTGQWAGDPLRLAYAVGAFVSKK